MTSSHGGNPWALMEENAFSLDEILDMSADLNPLGPPPDLGDLLEEGVKQVGWYPDPTYREFRQAVAQVEGVDPSRILVGNGTTDLIHLISRWQARADAAVVVPTFTEYERAVAADGGSVVPWPLCFEERFSPPTWNGALPFESVRLLFLCNPNNPTGTLWPEDQLHALAEICDQVGTFLVVDEATMDLVEDPLRYSAVPWVGDFRRLLVLRSMTKSFAVPGLRIGYLAASTEIVGELSRLQPPWAMNAVAGCIGRRLIRKQQYLKASRSALKEFREDLWNRLVQVSSIRTYPSAANFFLCRIEDPAWSNRPLAEKLRERGILVRTCDDFTGLSGGRFFRVAVRGLKENVRLVSALKEIFSGAG